MNDDRRTLDREIGIRMDSCLRIGRRYLDRPEPWIQMNHVDGPLLCMPDGSLHWLTLWERLLLWLDLTSAKALADKYARS